MYWYWCEPTLSLHWAYTEHYELTMRVSNESLHWEPTLWAYSESLQWEPPTKAYSESTLRAHSVSLQVLQCECGLTVCRSVSPRKREVVDFPRYEVLCGSTVRGSLGRQFAGINENGGQQRRHTANVYGNHKTTGPLLLESGLLEADSLVPKRLPSLCGIFFVALHHSASTL